MRLDKVSVSKYRSIDKQSSFEVGDYTVLIGPNNQGKSNLMRAAVLALEIIDAWSKLPNSLSAGTEVSTRLLTRRTNRTGPRLGRAGNLRVHNSARSVGYQWDVDYPLHAQTRAGAPKKTSIRLDFVLDAREQKEFQDETGLGINEKLPIAVELGELKSSIGIPKQRGSRHKEKASAIAEFVTKRIGLLYIPAVRPAAVAMGVAEEILNARRAILTEKPEYSVFVQELEKLEEEVSEEVGSIIEKTLQRFLPQVKSVALDTRSLARSAGLDDIRIDDGVGTSLTTKGDGIQSLVALALTLEWTKLNSDREKRLIVAVEEPESHLHPAGVHELRSVLEGMSSGQQVIITTHSQSLINSQELNRNIVVNEGEAKSARNIANLRESLGVRVSDSLVGAEVMVIGEGAHDERLLFAILRQRSPQVSELIAERRVIFESTGSASKVSNLAVAANAIMSTPIVVLDGDDAGRREAEKLIENSIVDRINVIQLYRPHAKATELEDLLEYECYGSVLEEHIGFKLNARESRIVGSGNASAWARRLSALLESRGVPDVENLVISVKGAINAHAVERVDAGEQVLRPDCLPLFERLEDRILRTTSKGVS